MLIHNFVDYSTADWEILENKLNWVGVTLRFKVVSEGSFLRYVPFVCNIDDMTTDIIEKNNFKFRIFCSVKYNVLNFFISEIFTEKLKSSKELSEYYSVCGVLKDILDICSEFSLDVPKYSGVGSISDILTISDILK